MNKKKRIELNKYYTKVEVAQECIELLKKVIPDFSSYQIVEPSAGSGVFLDFFENIVGYDIEPEDERIIKDDFLARDFVFDKDHPVLFIGNPPFGYKGQLAISFINKCLSLNGIVAFILPIQFRKWSLQSKINSSARLIMDETLPVDSFILGGEEYGLRTCFQVWAFDFTEHKDLRLTSKPTTVHPDFKMYQYNCTEEAKKFFDYNWDFALPRQGFNDYSKFVYSKNDCSLKKQWILFKAHDNAVLERLKKIDFNTLSQKNSLIPGFGKADVVEEYVRIYGT